MPNSTAIVEARTTPDQAQNDTLSQIEKNGMFFSICFEKETRNAYVNTGVIYESSPVEFDELFEINFTAVFDNQVSINYEGKSPECD